MASLQGRAASRAKVAARQIRRTSMTLESKPSARYVAPTFSAASWNMGPNGLPPRSCKCMRALWLCSSTGMQHDWRHGSSKTACNQRLVQRQA